MHYESELTLEAARERYFRQNGFSPTSPEWFVPIRIWRLTLPFPNSEARRRALPLHDTNHIVTEYDTDLPGESEIGAFELAVGCGTCWPAWFYDLGALLVGLIAWPRRTFRGFVRGRHARSLFREPERMAVETVGELRERLEISDRPAASVADVAAFAGMVLLAGVYVLTWPAFLVPMTANALAHRWAERRSGLASASGS